MISEEELTAVLVAHSTALARAGKEATLSGAGYGFVLVLVREDGKAKMSTSLTDHEQVRELLFRVAKSQPTRTLEIGEKN
ncbi:MAG: hypothetical protein ACOY0T_37790 [Myxococcota bacterium]